MQIGFHFTAEFSQFLRSLSPLPAITSNPFLRLFFTRYYVKPVFKVIHLQMDTVAQKSAETNHQGAKALGGGGGGDHNRDV